MSEVGSISLGQAIRNAVDAELAAAQFYDRLRNNTDDAEASEFLAEMVKAEHDHARSIEQLSKRLVGELPQHPDQPRALVETAPGWEWVEGMNLHEALGTALEAERQACLFYGAVADAFGGEAKAFFEQLSDTERQHADAIQARISRQLTD